MKITVKKLADLRKPAHNIRRHSDKQITEYIRSIEMFGQIKPLVVDEHGEIIAGNGLFEALTRMGREGTSSTKWMAISADDGSYITPDGSGTTANSVKLDIVSGHIQWSKTITTRNKDSDWPSCSFAAITCDSTISDAAKLVLQCLGMLPYKATDLCAKAGHQCWFRNLDAERAFFSGGHWSNSSYGLASFDGSYPRSHAWADVGFRAAFVKLPTA